MVLADHAYMCHICGHGDAHYTDHVIPLQRWKAAGGHPEDPVNLRPAHGALNRCQVCNRACNESKGDRPYQPIAQASRDW